MTMHTSHRVSAGALLHLCCGIAFLAAARPVTAGQRDQNPALDQAFRDFWAAPDTRARMAAAGEILATGAGPAEVRARLRGGPSFSARVPKGRLFLVRRAGEEEHRYVVVVPATYDPAAPTPVRFYLHGGVNTEARNSGERWDFDRFAAPGALTVFPSAWRGSMWWHESQVDNLLAILADLKRTYNVDERRVYVLGVSDGGSGAFFLTGKVPTPFAGSLALIGHAGILANPRLGPAAPLYVPNLRNTPLYVVNGALDPLYPVADVAPYLALFRAAGADLTFRPLAGVGHDLRWWPGESPRIEAWIRDHPRDPNPDSITWETERADRWNRAFWLVIDELGTAPGEAVFASFDSIVPLPPKPSLGVRADPSSDRGVRVLAVELGSIAAGAGLLAGDLIVEVNGAPTPTVRALVDATRDIDWGDSLVMVVQRGAARGSLVIDLGPRPDPATVAPVLAFPRRGPTGRVELVREGNTVRVRTSGVRRYTLLLSPDQFDFTRPIRVETNGRLSFEGRVEEDVEPMLRWAIGDLDRTMIYSAELRIDPGREP